MTAIEFPPTQKGASFTLDAAEAKIESAGTTMAKQDDIRDHHGGRPMPGPPER